MQTHNWGKSLRPCGQLLLLLLVLATSGCASLTSREKGALIGGPSGAAGGALLGAAAGGAVIGAAVGGPVGLIGGYLLGEHLFADAPEPPRPSPPPVKTKAQPRRKSKTPVTHVKAPPVPREPADAGRVF
ncbi:MAG: hypothetical protein FJZ47_17945 [Candidatus Tectomicrobia bacterium]|uniref:Glycine zipper domain-containing protein n=1 Tax=Tectimicrobiota bacterium TaxID=2528274 RepID=A0A937W2C7_UNCTE|nr:hypothetical protein [Candidatus Tectomicrobia bacterium]